MGEGLLQCILEPLSGSLHSGCPVQGSMWQDRLVAKLLQERQKGPASPWYPYLQVRP